jgi:penicillin-insensitive murein endopeptidase
MRLLILFSILGLTAFGQNEILNRRIQESTKSNITLKNYIKKHQNDSTPSESIGNVSDGILKNGKLLPFSGVNFDYFDEKSYLSGRAFTNHKVYKTVIKSYLALQKHYPNRKFKIMECSNEFGGKMWPHRTHQNGLSSDFMMPKIKNNKPYYGLDSLGVKHYWLSFDNNGRYVKDHSILIDFEKIAHHILILKAEGEKQNLTISKVIIKVELKDELFKGKYGQLLKDSGIYIVKSLTPIINAIHDDHYHIDFEEL